MAVPGERHLGPLESTFLFAMSAPIITLPIERIEKHRRREESGEEGYMDDRPLNSELAGKVDAVFGGELFKASPFYVPHAWRFASIPCEAGTNLAVSVPEELTTALAVDRALVGADELTTHRWATCLRNALSHGGILYLDDQGRSAKGQPTAMLGFVSAVYPRGDMRQAPERLVALRTTHEHYLQTLREWVRWLQISGMAKALAA